LVPQPPLARPRPPTAAHSRPAVTPLIRLRPPRPVACHDPASSPGSRPRTTALFRQAQLTHRHSGLPWVPRGLKNCGTYGPRYSRSAHARRLDGGGDQPAPGGLQPLGQDACDPMRDFVPEHGVGGAACPHRARIEFEGLHRAGGHGAECPLVRQAWCGSRRRARWQSGGLAWKRAGLELSAGTPGVAPAGSSASAVRRLVRCSYRSRLVQRPEAPISRAATARALAGLPPRCDGSEARPWGRSQGPVSALRLPR
jgi:hypothetical protein